MFAWGLMVFTTATSPWWSAPHLWLLCLDSKRRIICFFFFSCLYCLLNLFLFLFFLLSLLFSTLFNLLCFVIFFTNILSRSAELLLSFAYSKVAEKGWVSVKRPLRHLVEQPWKESICLALCSAWSLRVPSLWPKALGIHSLSCPFSCPSQDLGLSPPGSALPFLTSLASFTPSSPSPF